MKEVLRELIEIFQPNGIDWMGYLWTPRNPYTYHHCKEVRNGGKTTINNGAILTRDSHIDLNYYDNRVNHIYQQLNKLFKMLNNTKRPPTEEYFEELDYILKKVPNRRKQG
jgi:hypothetical protein